jgi:uncharacterized protein YaiE (UPF0345 family)
MSAGVVHNGRRLFSCWEHHEMRMIKFAKEKELLDVIGYIELKGGKAISMDEGACIGVIAVRKHIFGDTAAPRVITVVIE